MVHADRDLPGFSSPARRAAPAPVPDEKPGLTPTIDPAGHYKGWPSARKTGRTRIQQYQGRRLKPDSGCCQPDFWNLVH